MIGIYHDSFLDYLKAYCNKSRIKINNTNIIIPCPWCENTLDVKNHYHLWISKDIPIFNCFNGDCGHKGYIGKIFRAISGTDRGKNYFDESKVKIIRKDELEIKRIQDKQVRYWLPKLNERLFPEKTFYIKRRLKFEIHDINNIHNLIFDINKFIKENNLRIASRYERLLPYFQKKFVGFLTHQHGVLILRNIDHGDSFKFFKFEFQNIPILDYYRIQGSDYNIYSDEIPSVVIGEGVFDVWSDYIYNFTDLRKPASLYVAGLSTNFQTLIKSLNFHEDMFRINVHILADRNMSIDFFRWLKRSNKHVINQLIIYYNLLAKDFNDLPVKTQRFII